MKQLKNAQLHNSLAHDQKTKKMMANNNVQFICPTQLPLHCSFTAEERTEVLMKKRIIYSYK